MFATKGKEVKCCTPRGSDWRLLPEAIFFRIICHFKKVFTLFCAVLEVYWKIGEVQRGLGGEWHNKHGKSQLEEHTLAGATFSFQTMISCREFTPTRLTTGLGNVSCGSQP